MVLNRELLTAITKLVIKKVMTVGKMVHIIMQLHHVKVLLVSMFASSDSNIHVLLGCKGGELSLDEKVLKICAFGEWHRLCGDTWTLAQANVACRQLGRNPFGMSV